VQSWRSPSAEALRKELRESVRNPEMKLVWTPGAARCEAVTLASDFVESPGVGIAGSGRLTRGHRVPSRHHNTTRSPSLRDLTMVPPKSYAEIVHGATGTQAPPVSVGANGQTITSCPMSPSRDVGDSTSNSKR
jgi:hypothetical protein